MLGFYTFDFFLFCFFSLTSLLNFPIVELHNKKHTPSKEIKKMADPVEMTGVFDVNGNSVTKRAIVSVRNDAPEEFEEFAEAVFDSNGLQNNYYGEYCFQWEGKSYDNILEMLQDFPEFFNCDDKDVGLSTISDVKSLHFGDSVINM